MTRTRVFVRKYLTLAIDAVLVEDLKESKFEALVLYYKSFAKLDYLLWHKSYSWLLLLLSWRKILVQKWKYLKISGHFSQPFLISSLSLSLSLLSVSVSVSVSFSVFCLSVSLCLFVSLSLCLSLSVFLSGKSRITTQNIKFIQPCETELWMDKWIRNCQWRPAKKWYYVQIMILSSVHEHHI